MWVEILIVFFVGGFIGLDTSAAWQILYSHPLFVCSLLGIIFGEPQLGFFFGIIFGLIWLYDLPVGSAKFPEGNLSSFVGLMITLTLLDHVNGSKVWLVLGSSVYAVIVAYIVTYTIVMMRKNNLYLVKKADRYAGLGNLVKLERTHLLGVFHNYFHNGIWGLLFYLMGVFLIDWIISLLPPTAPFTLTHIQVLFLGIGFILMVDLFLSKKKIHYLLIGAICGIGIGFVL